MRADMASGCVNPAMDEGQRAAARGLSTADYHVLFGYLPIDSIEYCRLDSATLQKAVVAAQAKRAAAEAEGAGGLWLRFEAIFEEIVASVEGGESEEQIAAENGGRAAVPPDPEFFRLRFQDENGNIPADGNEKGRAHIAEMIAAQNGRAAGINSASWTSVGPGNIGGRIRALIIHPTNTSIMYCAGVAGGIWKSTNAGASWQILDDFMANMAVTSLAFDPSNPSIIYASTGELTFNMDASRGGGIFVSKNAGATWTLLASTTGNDFAYTSKIMVVKRSTKTQIQVASRRGIGTSKDGGVNWTWGKLTSGATWNPGYTGIFDFEVSPIDNMRMLAAGENKVWLSTNGGSTWQAATGIPAGSNAVELAWSKSSPTIVYASVDVSSGSIYKSTNSGASFSFVSNPKHLGTQGWYGNVLWVDPTDATALMMGGVDLFRSTNGGKNVTKLSDWRNSPLSPHADQHIIVADPKFSATNRKIYVGNDGGVYKTNNFRTATSSSGWTELNNHLGITQFYSARGDATAGKIVGGAQDNGNLVGTFSNTENWFDTSGGDGGIVALDTSVSDTMYTEYVMLSYLSRCTWVKWDCADITGYDYDSGTWKASQYVLGDAQDGTALFIAPFTIDPNTTSTLLAGGASLWRTTNARAEVTATTGPTWAAIKSPVGSGESAYITIIAVAKGNSDQIWVGTGQGGLWKTTNGTASAGSVNWTDTATDSMPGRSVTDIEVDPNSSSTVYATFGGYAADNLYKTTDGGATWASATGSGVTGLPAIPIWTVAIHPSHANWVYVGTELGIFTSEDGGATWQVVTDGPTKAPVYDLSWMGETLLAATHGRGIFSSATNH